MIEIKDLSFHFGLRTLFEGANLLVPDGVKMGVVGLNGCGKSTLFKLITGDLFPDGGKIDISRDTHIVSVAQDIKDPSKKLLQYVLEADREMTRLQEKLTQKQVNYLCQRRYTGWGRLSKKLLESCHYFSSSSARNFVISKILPKSPIL